MGVGAGARSPKPWEKMSLPAERKASGDAFGLTRCELEVVGKLAAGWTNKNIAHDLAISGETVTCHVANIFDKLGVSNRLELVLFAVYHQLIDHPGFDDDSP
jgi:DNA-binding NarL/FixJ family response regulator